MGDRAYTFLAAYPYRGRDQLTEQARAALELADAMPDSDEPGDEHPDPYLGDQVTVLRGDEQGNVLAFTDPEANYGTEAYRDVIDALTGAGLHVYAGNEAGGDYSGCCEHHPPAGHAGTVEVRRADRGELVVAASDLLGRGETSLDDVGDSDLARRARRMLTAPDGMPAPLLKAVPW